MVYVVIFGAIAIFFIFIWLFICVIYDTVVAIIKQDFRNAYLYGMLFIGLSLVVYVLVSSIVNYLSEMLRRLL